MKGRNVRLKSIKKLIKSCRIESQETLLGLLQQEGYEVTQATLSRDLKLLKVGKVSDGHDGYVYTLPDDENRQDSELTMVQDFLRGYISIECSGNIAVIKTLSGYANAVTVIIDDSHSENILGTIAGDDTIFIVMHEYASHKDILDHLSKLFKNIGKLLK